MKLGFTYQKVARAGGRGLCMTALALTTLLPSGCRHGCYLFPDEAACSSGEVWDGGMRIEKCAVVDTPSVYLPKDLPSYQLADLIDIGLSNHSRTKKSWASARAAAFTARDAKTAYIPTIDDTVTGWWMDTQSSRSAGSSSGSSSVKRVVKNELTLSYLLLDFGGRSAGVDSAYYALRSLNWQHNRVVQDVIIDIVRAYYNYSAALASIEAKESDLKDAQISLEAAETLFHAGLKTYIDVLQSKANFVNRRLALEKAKGQLNIGLGALKTTLAIPVSTPLEVKVVPDDLPMEQVSNDIDALIDEAKNCRSDLIALRATLLQKEVDLTTVNSDLLPSLSANMTLDNNRYNHSTNHDYSGTIELTIPLSDSLVHGARVHSAEEQIKAAQADILTKESDVVLEVLTDYYNVQTNTQTLKYSEEYLKYAKESLEAVQAAYAIGIVSIVDLIAAQAVLANARDQRIAARVGWLTSLADLAYATGTLGSNDACRSNCK